ncbi:MAG TPA: flagellar basal body P-ring protein FlgI, partial [Armatimonadota bacterium]|nr:flagellar basal body P-ring protein FlgI [Armatimonadota bacterium]
MRFSITSQTLFRPAHRFHGRRQASLLFAVMLIPGVILGNAAAATAQEARLKDVARVAGVRDNQLCGYGLVVGLDSSGDSNQVTFTPQAVANMLQHFGIVVPADQLKT